MSDAVVTLPARTPPAAAPVPPGRRLAWLDALRGFAALCVVFDHMGYHVLQHGREIIYQYFDPGLYGVFVFFMVSGYIVPASLERKGSLRAFWVSRVFRLYPIYGFALLVAIVEWKIGIGSLSGTNYTGETSALTHVFMLSNVLGPQNAIGVIWTLSYEMTFYLLLTALFVTGTHRLSSRWALGFAVAALAVGGLLPMRAISGSFLGTRLVAEIADLLIGCGVLMAVTRLRLPRKVGALTAGGTAMVLLCFNGNWVNPFEALTILALMFTGTMLYRAERGQFSKRAAAVIMVAVFALAIAAGLWHVPYWYAAPAQRVPYDWQWASAVLLSGATFMVGMAYRHKKVPGVLAWLGVISYSVYLLHPLLFNVYDGIPGTGHPHPFPEQVLLAAAFLAALLGCCALSHRFIEVPMQRQGRKLAAWLDTWFGPDLAPGQPAPSAAIRERGAETVSS